MLSSSSLDRTVLWHDTDRQDFLLFYLEFAILGYHDSKTSKVISYNSPKTMCFFLPGVQPPKAGFYK